MNYELIDRKLEQINAVSDVQIVAMHWGEEYHTEPNEEQRQLAQYLNSKGVEVIIGTHPHVIEPVEFIETADQTTLVYYSLGNFISAQDTNETMVGGMANFRLNYDFDTKKTTFSDVQFIPTITWISPDLRQYRTTTIHEYNDEWAANHFITANGMDISKAWVQQYVSSIIQG
ncbi:capsule biosynthesis protein CapA, partial [gut metagenome]